MVDLPGRPVYEPADREDGTPPGRRGGDGWGSPVPAEYGSLHAVRPLPDAEGAPDPRPAAAPRRARNAKKGSTRTRATSPKSPGSTGGAGGTAVAPASNMSALLQRIQGDEPAAATAEVAPSEVSQVEEAQVEAAAPPAVQPADPGSPAAVEALEPVPAAAAPARPPPARAADRPGRAAAPSALATRRDATVRHLDMATVAKVSVVFYLIVLVVVVVASMLLWYAADAFGTLTSFEKSIRTLFSLKSFQIHPATVALYTSAGGLVLAVAGTIANVLMALIYNLIADLVGGIRVEIDQDPPAEPRPAGRPRA
ncbi:MAG: DUF3566 domain-containing protein [Acidimicrobiales bacterium]|nr:DUF3566 domain-containing protein [Acidimicrobiales bacterium]